MTKKISKYIKTTMEPAIRPLRYYDHFFVAQTAKAHLFSN